MTENFIGEMLKSKFVAPSKESLLEKIVGLEEAISRHEKNKMAEDQRHILHICRDYIRRLRNA